MSGRPRRGRRRIEIDMQWLTTTLADIKSGIKTIQEVKRSVPVRNRMGKFNRQTVSEKILRNKLRELDNRFTAHKGRPQRRITDDVKKKIKQIHDDTKMGVTKCYAKIVTRSIDDAICRAISHRMVYNEYINQELLKYKIEKKKPDNRCRYVACNPNLIWHTDLHDWFKEDSNHKEYLIAFIDDYSRKVIHFDFLPNKTAINTTNFLNHALELNSKPFSIWTDNGGEFKAEFNGLMMRSNIKHVWTEPGNPQQNGKVERFWQSAEKCKNKAELKKWIKEYNNLPHFSLQKVVVLQRQTYQTPNEAFDSKPAWNPNIPPLWEVDGRLKPFVPRSDFQSTLFPNEEAGFDN